MEIWIRVLVGTGALGLAMWLFVTAETRARLVRERLERMPRRLGQTPAGSATPRMVRFVAVVGVLVAAWIMFEGVRMLK